MSNGGEKDGEEGELNLKDLIGRHTKHMGKSGVMEVNYTEAELRTLLDRARQIMADQPSLVETYPPIVVVGDIHGQFTDLLRIFGVGGLPSGKVSYLFLGDYVDRGRQSLECICLLLACKVKYPKNVLLLRGNHECANINRVYGFYDECKRRFSTRLWRSFQAVFDVMPLAGLIGGRILCMHGGLSPEMQNLDAIRRIRRPITILDHGLACDLLWADPDRHQRGWGRNNRGISYVFGPDTVRQVAAKLDIDLVARAHQVVQDGYEFFAGKRLVTIFSAPNYCNEFTNRAAIMFVAKDMMCSFNMLAARKEVRAAAGQSAPHKPAPLYEPITMFDGADD